MFAINDFRDDASGYTDPVINAAGLGEKKTLIKQTYQAMYDGYSGW